MKNMHTYAIVMATFRQMWDRQTNVRQMWERQTDVRQTDVRQTGKQMWDRCEKDRHEKDSQPDVRQMWDRCEKDKHEKDRQMWDRQTNRCEKSASWWGVPLFLGPCTSVKTTLHMRIHVKYKSKLTSSTNSTPNAVTDIALNGSTHYFWIIVCRSGATQKEWQFLQFHKKYSRCEEGVSPWLIWMPLMSHQFVTHSYPSSLSTSVITIRRQEEPQFVWFAGWQLSWARFDCTSPACTHRFKPRGMQCFLFLERTPWILWRQCPARETARNILTEWLSQRDACGSDRCCW